MYLSNILMDYINHHKMEALRKIKEDGPSSDSPDSSDVFDHHFKKDLEPLILSSDSDSEFDSEPDSSDDIKSVVKHHFEHMNEDYSRGCRSHFLADLPGQEQTDMLKKIKEMIKDELNRQILQDEIKRRKHPKPDYDPVLNYQSEESSCQSDIAVCDSNSTPERVNEACGNCSACRDSYESPRVESHNTSSNSSHESHVSSSKSSCLRDISSKSSESDDKPCGNCQECCEENMGSVIWDRYGKLATENWEKHIESAYGNLGSDPNLTPTWEEHIHAKYGHLGEYDFNSSDEEGGSSQDIVIPMYKPSSSSNETSTESAYHEKIKEHDMLMRDNNYLKAFSSPDNSSFEDSVNELRDLFRDIYCRSLTHH